MEKRYTRSQVPLAERNRIKEEKYNKKKPKLAIDKAPYVTYSGKLLYYTEFVDCAEACEKLLNLVAKTENFLALGFDLEWPFNFQTGPGKVATVQISPSLDECYILHISKMNKIPKSLTELITHPNVRLTGNNIKNDVRKLGRDFPGFDIEKAIANCIDLSPLANQKSDFTQRWSMAKLVEHFCAMRINKDKKVRMSKWHVIPLTEAQQIYAAIDAYMSLKLYQQLIVMPSKDDE